MFLVDAILEIVVEKSAFICSFRVVAFDRLSEVLHYARNRHSV